MTKSDPWSIEYKEEPWSTIHEGKTAEGIGFYRISFEGLHYDFISKEAWDKQNTGEILAIVECMLNDAHRLALKEHE